MAISQRLDLRQSQTLVMTPQLQQSIKLLQLNNLELDVFVEHELEQNPLLERDDGPADAEAEPAEADSGEPVESDRALSTAEDMADGAPLADIDLSAEDYWQGESEGLRASESGLGAGPSSSPITQVAGEESSIDQAPAPGLGLREHLHSQLGASLADPADRLIGSHLIELLDDAGYLMGPIDQVATLLNCPIERVEATLETVQGFEPAGVFARSLAECLALQLKERGRLSRAMAILVDNLDCLAAGDLPRLKRLCAVSEARLGQMIAELRSLDPKPGLVFDSEIPQTVVPDVFVHRTPDGGWGVELNTETLPRIMINARYYAELRGRARESNEKAFISSCLQNANWLVRSLDQRARTILKVSTELVRRQENFLTRGIQELRPLTLRDIADAIEMHESTVSRVSTNKFISTPRGVYELKFFFSASLGSTSGGEEHAAEAVRHRIRELIGNEEPGTILSDERIADLLSGSGVRIARRTVAKYREAMHIPSSVQRRRQKARQSSSV